MHNIFKTEFGKVYLLYIAKVERKGRSKSELDQIIMWLTGYTAEQLDDSIKNQLNFEEFFGKAPNMNPLRALIKGSICGVKIDEIEDPLMKEIRYLDKLVDELAKGKSLEKILRH